MAVVLSWVIAGIPRRWADQPIEVVAEDGSLEPVPGGLVSVQVDQAGDTSPGGVSVEVDTADRDLAALVQAGHAIDGVAAEVAELDDGDDWAARRIVGAGTTSGVEYGERGAGPTRLQIGALWDDQGALPFPDAVVDDGYPDAPEASAGRLLPVVIGRPSSTPAVIVSATLAVIACHPVLATSVQIREREPVGAWSSATVITETHPTSGRQMSAVVQTGFTSIEVDWSGSDGGHPPRGPGSSGLAPRAVPDVAAVLLSYATIPWDRAAWASADWLRPYLLDLYVDETATPMAVLADALRGMPTRIEAGPRGIRPVPTASAERADLGPLVDLDSPDDGDTDGRVSITGSAPPATVTVRYSPDAWNGGSPTRSITLQATQGPRAGRRAATTAGLNTAAPSAELVLGHVVDDGTAARVAAAVVRERYARRVLAFVSRSSGRFGRLRVGDPLRVSRAGLGLDEHPARVESVRPTPIEGLSTITVRLLDDPARWS